MAEYIEREALIKAIDNNFAKFDIDVCNPPYYDGANDEYADVRLIIHKQPAADVQPVKRGEWEKKSSVGVFRCSLCQHIFMLGTDEIDEYHFCPHCGADMRNDSNLMKTEVEGLFLNFEQEV